LSEGNGSISIYFCLEPRLAHGLFDYLHIAAENPGQACFEFAQATEIVESGRRETLAETYRNINVIRSFLAARDGSEQGYTRNPNPAELRFKSFQCGYDLFAAHAANLA
jgi:hypothetical protein